PQPRPAHRPAADPGDRQPEPQPTGDLHGPPDEATWASSSLGLGRRPASASQWQESEESTWGGRGQPVPPAEPRRQAPPVGGEPELESWQRLDEPEPEPRKGRASKVATAFKRRRGGVSSLRMPLAITAGLLCLALLGAVAYYFLGKDLPGIGDETKYFDGVNVSTVMSRVGDEGFECIPGRAIAQCEKQVKGADLSITVHFAGEAEITKIEASGGTAAYSDEEVAPEELQGFFAMAAVLPQPDDSGEAGTARDWATQNVGKAGEQTVGDVRYESSGDQPLLVMTPA
ncbi:MAG: hypothetical protein ACRDT6_29215, partial [Micromonosporaceae bacterium]